MSGDHNQYQKATGCEMNTDLIRRLEKQCWNYQANCLDAEKFAQLIVAECVGVVEGGSFLHDQAPTAIFARECSHAIKEHFGVEL